MALLIKSSDVFKKTQLEKQQDDSLHCIPVNGNLGSLPTLFSENGQFLQVPNSYLFYLKAIKEAKDLNPCAQALLKYYQFLEDEKIEWNVFPPIKRLKPTYQFRSHLLKTIKRGELAHSTGSSYMNHIKNFYLWAMYERYLVVEREEEAPFKIEFVTVQNHGMLAHMKPAFTVETSDLRIKVPRDSDTQNIRTLTPLTQENLNLLTSYLHRASEELRLQLLISLDTGMRIQEISTFTKTALDSAAQAYESQHRYELLLCPQATGVETKYGKRRKVEISAELLNALKGYLISERRLKRANKLNATIERFKKEEISLKNEMAERLQKCERHEPLFISQQGNPVTRETIEARWVELRADIQASHVNFKHRFHDFRSTYGTYRLHDLLNANLGTVESLELLMGWMGHKDEKTTWKYLQFLKRREVFKVKFGILDSIMHEALAGENNE